MVWAAVGMEEMMGVFQFGVDEVSVISNGSQDMVQTGFDMVANYDCLDEMTGMETAMEFEIRDEEMHQMTRCQLPAWASIWFINPDLEMEMEGRDKVSALFGYASKSTSVYEGEDMVAMDEKLGDEQTEDVQEGLVGMVLDDLLKDSGGLASDNVLTSPGQMTPMQNSDEETSSLLSTNDSMNMGNAAAVGLHVSQEWPHIGAATRRLVAEGCGLESPHNGPLGMRGMLNSKIQWQHWVCIWVGTMLPVQQMGNKIPMGTYTVGILHGGNNMQQSHWELTNDICCVMSRWVEQVQREGITREDVEV